MFASVLHWAISVPASLGKDALSSPWDEGVLVRQDVGLVLREVMVVCSSGSGSSLWTCWSRVVGFRDGHEVVRHLVHSHRCKPGSGSPILHWLQPRVFGSPP